MMKKLIINIAVSCLLVLVVSPVYAGTSCMCRSETRWYDNEGLTGGWMAVSLLTCDLWTYTTPHLTETQGWRVRKNSDNSSTELFIMHWNGSNYAWHNHTTSLLGQVSYDQAMSLPLCVAPYTTLLDELPPPPPPCEEQDADEDGVPDLCDPWPSFYNGGTTWTIMFEWSNGGVTYSQVGYDGNAMDVGACSGTHILVISNVEHDFATLLNGACDCNNPIDVTPRINLPEYDVPTSGGDSGNATSEDRPPATYDPADGGSTSGGDSGNATSTPQIPVDYQGDDNASTCCPSLGTIAENTEKLVVGQNDMRDYLAALQESNSGILAVDTQIAENTGILVEGQNDMRGYLASIQNNTAFARVDLRSISENTGDMAGKLDGIEDDAEVIKDNTTIIADDIEDSTATAVGGLEAIDTTVAGLEFANYTSEDVPDGNGSILDYEGSIDSFIATSEVSGVADDVGVSLSSPVSSLAVSVWGSNIVFDFAPWESFFDLLGIAFLSLCYLGGFFLILRG